jgi:hypothetical protein
MKAGVCKEPGPPEHLVLEEIAPIALGQGQVVVAVKACGVNFPDTLIIAGKYQFKPDLPFSPISDVDRMHEDTDRVILHRLQPVALGLAQVWLTWYAETAGLIHLRQVCANVELVDAIEDGKPL